MDAGDITRVLFTSVLLVALACVFYFYHEPTGPFNVIVQPPQGHPSVQQLSEDAPPGPLPTAAPVTGTNSLFPSAELVYRLKVIKTLPHDQKAYTQGLLYLGQDTLYESTGIYGKSSVRKVDLTTGKVLHTQANQASDFGEGLSYYQGFFWQLYWKTHKVCQYDPATLKLLGTYSMPSSFDFQDGWGLTSSSDGIGSFYEPGKVPADETLYVTDSGTKLYKVKFEGGAFHVVEKVTVTTPDGRMLEMPNELELIGKDEMWANIYGMDCIARLNPHTGKVFGWVLANDLRRISLGTNPEVFNGIAWDKQGGRMWVTGKLWNKMFEVTLEPVKISAARLDDLCVPKRNVFHR